MTERVTKTNSFKNILDSYTVELPEHLRCVMGIDPGETTGIAIFQNGNLIHTDQLDCRKSKSVSEAGHLISQIIDKYKPNTIVIEDYRVYKHKADEHTNSDLFTSRLIGTVEFIVDTRELPLIKQMASYAKRFMTNQKLKDWDFWIKGKKHSRDAIRHAAMYILMQTKKANS